MTGSNANCNQRHHLDPVPCRSKGFFAAKEAAQNDSSYLWRSEQRVRSCQR